MPWIILGDFNCCRHPYEKSGGYPLSSSQTWDLNAFIFDVGLLDLASKGLKFTWFNQRANDPIHLKLDRMLVNDKWLELFPYSFYEVANPSCSDHSSIILQSSQIFKSMHRGAVLPQSCLKQIGKMCAKFLYFGDSNVRKLHLISWNNTCKSKILGGLGIPNLKALQFASCCSLIIRFYNSSSILFDYLNVKYGTPWTPVSNKASPLWNCMNMVAGKISPSILFAYTPNSKIFMLWDPCFNGYSLSSSHCNSSSSIPFSAKVSDYVVEGIWNLPDALYANLVHKLNCFPINIAAANSISWKDNKSCFSVYLLEFHKGDPPVYWFKLVWHKHFALKYSIYTWLALNRGLKTADILSKRNILIENTCPLCFAQPESIEHLFFECDYAFFCFNKVDTSSGEFPFTAQTSSVCSRLAIVLQHFSCVHSPLAALFASVPWMAFLATRRRKTQPISERSAGSVFRNPVGCGVYAGELIDIAGLKGCVIGGAKVSELHANFIINTGEATAKDVLALIAFVKDKVDRMFGIELKEEISEVHSPMI
ncbi:hypothetical protein M5K25_008004 [Dendrobium thyrsiflorum]|uniref:UDP-N-acetylmuramate dehydrogenase n=1 Tax=Dendrobium thyrsiflorum TaxID=117978 RepID=A0ABD0VEC0_DENTH